MNTQENQITLGGDFAFTFQDFVKDTLTASAYEKLPETLGITKTRLTQVFNNPKEADEPTLRAFAKVLNKSAYWLIKDWELAKSRISAETADQIKQECIQELKRATKPTQKGTNPPKE